MVKQETWELDFEWLRVRHSVQKALSQDKLPDLNNILLLIGIQELGIVKPDYSKSEKMDLMHIAVCRLLSQEGYYEFEAIDSDGWPHWKQLMPFSTKGLKDQEYILKSNIVRYFKTETTLLNE
ncbi:MAG: hypothetical protein ABIV51_01655 [Saprospiraceae bacterium]